MTPLGAAAAALVNCYSSHHELLFAEQHRVDRAAIGDLFQSRKLVFVELDGHEDPSFEGIDPRRRRFAVRAVIVVHAITAQAACNRQGRGDSGRS